MKIAYFDCASGISGDMTVAALIDAGVDVDVIKAGIGSLGLPGVSIHLEEVMRGGFRAKHLRVEHPEQSSHRNLSDIQKIINRSEALTDEQRDLALRIFKAVADAEAYVHGSTVEKVHFHEVGAIDSIVDITAAAIGLTLLDVEEIVCSPIPTGFGKVRIAHGVCSIPTPGTAELLKGVPLIDVPIEAELTTPTGAAIVKMSMDRFSDILPEMTIEKIGYGAGTKDFKERANVVRLFIGTVRAESVPTEGVMLLETNIDNTTAEVIGYTKRRLMSAGALDVYSSSIQMKKDRPGTLLSVMCKPEDVAKLENILFHETSTLGIRRQLIQRSVCERQSLTVDTDYGPIKGKMAWRPGEPVAFNPEYEDCAAIAKAHDIPLRDVLLTAQLAFHLSAEDDEDFTDDDEDWDHDHDHSHDHDCQHDHDHDHRHDHHHHDHDGGHDQDHDHR